MSRHRVSPAIGTTVVVAPPGVPPDARALRLLDRIGHSGMVAVPPVALPDLHVKPRLETPSSVATATRDTLVLGLTSPSPNCGMMLMRTALTAGDLDPASVGALLGTLARSLKPGSGSQRLTSADMHDVLQRGAPALVERYGLDPAIPRYMDQGGSAVPTGTDPGLLQQVIPAAIVDAARGEFGQVGRGNHFLELQEVEEVCDDRVARAWSLARGQIVVMAHADSGRLGAWVGRLYAHRQKNSWRGRLYEWQVKVPFQLRAGSPRRLVRRLAYHVLPRRWAPIPVDSEEGRRALLALQTASNYAYANRVAVMAALGEAMQAVWGNGCELPALIWDAPHNGIRLECFGPEGPNLWVHRHNAARVAPASDLPAGSPYRGTGQPVLMPGTERVVSYLCVGGTSTAQTLYSVNHGAGQLALRLGRSTSGAGVTRVYGYDDPAPDDRPHLSDEGMRAIVNALVSADIAHPVARLRPVAALKG